jgi:hypothetical protein
MRTRMTAAIGAAALAVGVSMSAMAPASAGPARTVGDSCLVGTWHDNAYTAYTRWEGHNVKMRYGGNDFDHITATGYDHDNWDKSKPGYGRYAGSRLKQLVRGIDVQTMHATKSTHEITVTLVRWEHGKNLYWYRGTKYIGWLAKHYKYTVHYACGAHTLKWISKGKVYDTETRVSTTP